MLTIQDIARIESQFQPLPGQTMTAGDHCPDEKQLLCADWRAWQTQNSNLDRELFKALAALDEDMSKMQALTHAVDALDAERNTLAAQLETERNQRKLAAQNEAEAYNKLDNWRLQNGELRKQLADIAAELARFQEVVARENTQLDAWIAKAGEHQRDAAATRAELERARDQSVIFISEANAMQNIISRMGRIIAGLIKHVDLSQVSQKTRGLLTALAYEKEKNGAALSETRAARAAQKEA